MEKMQYMRKGFLIYEEMRKYLVIYSMRRLLVIYDFATAPFRISIYMRKIFFSFLSVYFQQKSMSSSSRLLTCMWTTWLYLLSLISMSSRPSLVRIFSQASRSMKAEASIVPRSAIMRTFWTQHTNHVFPTIGMAY